KRVGGPWGHLSNQQAAGFLQRVDLQRLQQLVVAHISQQNNSVERAREALAETIADIPQVLFACQDEGFGWQQLS
ncbi:MAG: MBL fold metallo-hydrolase, partial [Pseudomonadota bacterium]|nr:MBL fold metallo-hydrolase [Pseudomonadota bacterium]